MTQQVCPHCHKPIRSKKNPHRPFCSKRCRMVDLGHWFSEDYSIPTEDSESEKKAEEQPDERKKRKQ